MRPGPIFFACDEGYAMPLATALRSLAESNAAAWPLDIRVLVEAAGPWQAQVQMSLPAGAATIRWITVDLAGFAAFSTIPHVSRLTFARLLIPHLLPDSSERILYLDADTLVLGALGPLFATDLGGCAVGAVADAVDGAIKAGDTAGPRVERYFNAGVLLIDLGRWREAGIPEAAVAYLRQHPDTPYADQDALNVACDGRWQPLESTWNFMDFYQCVPLAALPPAQRPAIVHFAAWIKPWDYSYASMNAAFHDGFRSRTRFARPPAERWRDALRTAWIRTRRAAGARLRGMALPLPLVAKGKDARP